MVAREGAASDGVARDEVLDEEGFDEEEELNKENRQRPTPYV